MDKNHHLILMSSLRGALATWQSMYSNVFSALGASKNYKYMDCHVANAPRNDGIWQITSSLPAILEVFLKVRGTKRE